MTPATYELFLAIVSADILDVQRALAAGADVNARDELGRNVLSYAALGTAIDTVHSVKRPRLSERRLDILRLITQQPALSLYSLNAPMAWAGGVTLLGLMSWLNMPSEIVCLFDFTNGLLEVNAMDDHGATAIMYAARDGNLQVAQRLLAYGARPDLREVSQRSAIQYALLHPQILWLCEEALQHSRQSEFVTSSFSVTSMPRAPGTRPYHPNSEPPPEGFFFNHPRFLTPPPMAWFDETALRRIFDSLLRAIRMHDFSTLQMVLCSPPSNSDSRASREHLELSSSLEAPLLVNLRDSTGLTLVHHAVSQRPYPNIAILDALYNAGSDVGLFSTLGFSPLHHLARTAKDDAQPAEREQMLSHSHISSRTHPLYTFTRHLVRDLRASLRATDSKGETPLHAAAEHGRSVSVLLAMLDCDRESSGTLAVRESRNERGLRPVDVARREFVPLFLGRHHSHPTLRSDTHRHGFTPPNNQQHLLSGLSLSTSHIRSNRLTKKESHTSLMSRSSASSTSSGAHSYGSYWSSFRLPRLHRLYNTKIHNTLPTPEPTPASSFIDSPVSLHESYLSIDAPACSNDILHHLSSSAYALHAYTQYYTRQGMDTNTLPDLPALADTLLFTRDLASHVLEHWTARLETAREAFERIRRDLSKAKALREYVGRDVQSTYPTQRTRITRRVGSKLRKVSSGDLQRPAAPVIFGMDIPDSSEDLHQRRLSPVDSGDSSSNEEVTTQVLADFERILPPHGLSADKGRSGRPHADHAMVMEGHDAVVVARPEQLKLDLKPPPSELINISDEGCVSDRDVVLSTCGRVPDVGDISLPPNNAVETPVAFPPDVSMTPMILLRADQDLQEVLDHFALIHQSYAHAQKSIGQARALVEESIKGLEERLALIFRIHHRQDIVAQSSRLSPILERSPRSAPHDTLISNIDFQSIIALGPIEEPHMLRRLLTRKLAKYVQNVFDNLQKAQVWLRVIREVLRGFQRRALIQVDTVHHPGDTALG